MKASGNTHSLWTHFGAIATGNTPRSAIAVPWSVGNNHGNNDANNNSRDNNESNKNVRNNNGENATNDTGNSNTRNSNEHVRRNSSILKGPTLTMEIREITMAAIISTIILGVAIVMVEIMIGTGILIMARAGEMVLEVLSNIGHLM